MNINPVKNKTNGVLENILILHVHKIIQTMKLSGFFYYDHLFNWQKENTLLQFYICFSNETSTDLWFIIKKSVSISLAKVSVAVQEAVQPTKISQLTQQTLEPGMKQTNMPENKI